MKISEMGFDADFLSRQRILAIERGRQLIQEIRDRRTKTVSGVERVRQSVPCPEGATDNSQGRKPLDKVD